MSDEVVTGAAEDLSPSPLDGNAIAGPLMEIFSIDLTSASGKCDHCGSVRHLAEAVVFMDAPGHVVRCRSCDGVLLRLVVSDDRMWLDVRGLSYLQIERAN
jgi:Family of unknown function (DUF6510)